MIFSVKTILLNEIMWCYSEGKEVDFLQENMMSIFYIPRDSDYIFNGKDQFGSYLKKRKLSYAVKR